jgi:hypothetical protein
MNPFSQEFRESRMTLRFDPSWRVLAFDRTDWFRRLTGRGLKGVDLLGLHEGRLWLIELKNYTPVPGVNRPDLPSAGQLLADWQAKGRDTLRMITVIHAALSRHFLFRLWLWLAARWAWVRRLEPEWAFWQDARVARDAGCPTTVLLLHGWPEHKPLQPSGKGMILDAREAPSRIPGLDLWVDADGFPASESQ